MEKYYIDTCIWIDLLENRVNLGVKSQKLIFNIIMKEEIILSDVIIKELKRFYTEEEIRSMFFPFKKYLKRIISNKEQFSEAKQISDSLEIPLGDALHAIIARDNNSTLISRDKHFYKLKKICRFKRPEEFI
jgi:predicted nucleic acid-binding protein